jgi:type 2 lantibiotic biosynthesis protein LanM
MASLSLEQRRAIVFGAQPLYQRVAGFAARSSVDEDAPISQEANATLQSWSQVFAPGDRQAFLRRLSWDGLDWTTVARALSAGDLSASDVDSREPDWTEWLDRTLDAAGTLLRELDRGPAFEAGYFEPDEEPPFIELAIPALRAARSALDRVCPDAFSQFAGPAQQALERQLLKELAVFGERTVFELFRQVTSETPTSSASSEAQVREDRKYREFVRSMLDDGLTALFVAYPVLARVTARLMEKWVESTSDLSRRLEADRPEIVRHFAGGVDLGAVASIAPALSDPHNGRRRVAALTFDSGLRLIYKPRTVGVEKALSDFLEWTNVQGVQPQRVLKVIERTAYGWVEFAEHEAFTGIDEVRRYYRQAGSLAAIAHLLGATDLHMENVVATRRGPVLVDPESILQPGRPRAQDPRPGSGVKPPAGPPCVATGLITFAEGGADGGRYETGGLRGTGLRGTARARRVWKGIRSDALHFKDEHEFQAPSANRVVLDGVVQRLEDYQDELIEGFTSAYRQLAAKAGEVTAPGGPLAGFAGRQVRILFRPTNQYAVVQDVLAAPKYQASGVTRTYGFDALARPFALDQTRPVAWPLAIAEREALERLDIPHFTVGADDIVLRAGDRVIGDRFFARPGLDVARERVLGMSEADLQFQLAWIARSLAESATSHFHIEPVFPSPSGKSDAEDLTRLHVSLAEWIGREFLDRAVRTGESLTWTLQPPGVTPVGAEAHYLDGGSLGPALFLSALAQVTGDRSWAEAARLASAAASAFAARSDLRAAIAGTPLGIGGGLGSLIYGLLWIGKLLGDDSYIDLAARVARSLEPADTGSDRDTDVLGGSAGAILALLALQNEIGGPFLDRASAYGEHLIAAQVHTHWGSNWLSRDGRLLSGFAHGAAGIAYSLIRLFEATGKRTYLEAALRGHRYERAVFSPLHRNWPLIRSAGHLPGNVAVVMTAWCHGAPGIGLARALVRDTVIGDDPEVAGEIDVALTTTAALPGNPGDHLCCGNIGRCEVLLTAGRRLARQSAIDAATALATRVEQQVLRRQRFQFVASGYEYIVFDATFFHGLSGIGYQLLRLAAPSDLPSVMAFEGPVTARAEVAAIGTEVRA